MFIVIFLAKVTDVEFGNSVLMGLMTGGAPALKCTVMFWSPQFITDARVAVSSHRTSTVSSGTLK